MGDLKTPFKDACESEVSNLSGDWGGTKDGDRSFQGAKKGDRGKIPEVTFVDVQSAPKPGAAISADGKSVIAGKSVKKDLTAL